MHSINMSLEKINISVCEQQIILSPKDNLKKFLKSWRLDKANELEISITYEKHQEVNKLYQNHHLRLSELGFGIEKKTNEYILTAESVLDIGLMQNLLILLKKVNAISEEEINDFNKELLSSISRTPSPISSDDEDYYADTSDNEDLNISLFSISPYSVEQKIQLLFKTNKPDYSAIDVKRTTGVEPPSLFK